MLRSAEADAAPTAKAGVQVRHVGVLSRGCGDRVNVLRGAEADAAPTAEAGVQVRGLG